MSFNNLQDTQTLWGKCLELDTLSKAVMQVLINHRNSASGLCAPGMSLIAKETGMSLRSVKARIASLTESGHLKIIERGTFSTANRYAIDLGSAGDALGESDALEGSAGDALEVGQEMHHPSCTGRTTPSAGDAPKQISKQINQQIKNKEDGFAAPAARTRSFIPPEVASGQIDRAVFNDWLQIRRAKRAPLTATAWAGVVREAEKAGLPLDRALSLMVEHSWQGLKADWQEVKAEAARAQGKPEPRQGSLFAQGPPQEQYRSPYAEPSPEVKARQKAQQERATRWANYQAALRRQKQGLEVPKSMAEWLKPGYVEGELKCNA